MRSVHVRRSTIRSAGRLALAAAVVAAAACGGDSSTGPGSTSSGAFSGTVSGAFTRALTGVAASGPASDDAGGQTFGIVLTDGMPTDTGAGAIVLARAGPRPAAGTYPMADVSQADGVGAVDPGTQFFAIYFPNSAVRFGGVGFFTTRGTLTISESNAAHVKGGFDVRMEALRLDDGPPLEIEVKGSFDAPQGTVPAGLSRARVHDVTLRRVRR